MTDNYIVTLSRKGTKEERTILNLCDLALKEYAVTDEQKKRINKLKENYILSFITGREIIQAIGRMIEYNF